MGLDMYLTKRRYVKNWNFTKPEEKHTVTVKRAGKVIKDKMPVTDIIYEAGYWRKANAIHKWFVDNCAKENYTGAEVYVSEEQLQELLDKCKLIVEKAVVVKGKIQNGSRMVDGEWKPIMEDGEFIQNDEEIAGILPTESGFFFGSTDYDEWYLADIKATIPILENCLDDTGDCSFYYSASW